MESYSNAFWETAEDALSQDWPRILANIEKGEAKVNIFELLVRLSGSYCATWLLFDCLAATARGNGDNIGLCCWSIHLFLVAAYFDLYWRQESDIHPAGRPVYLVHD